MKVVRSFADLAPLAEKISVAIGVFDGVHLGHQAVVRAALEDAHGVGGTAVVLTFDPHPARILAPDKAPPLLTSTQHKLALIESLGVPVCFLIAFTPAFAKTEPEAFLEQLARSVNQLQSICVGQNFRFGHNRRGDRRTILAFGQKHRVHVDVLPSVTANGETISSTAIRTAITSGDLVRAEQMLGRAFSVIGTVEPGDQIGRSLGYPTANLNPHNEVLPPNGVYAVRVVHGDRNLRGMVNIGMRPTIASAANERRFELHILDFAGHLYGQSLEVVFVKKLREERKFPSTAELKTQIARDEAEARQILTA